MGAPVAGGEHPVSRVAKRELGEDDELFYHEYG
jgi:hypothetical protein